MYQEVNQFNFNPGLLNKYRTLLQSNLYWHKVIIENVAGLDRDAVLRTIMRFCQSLQFIPVHYQSNNNTSSFLLKNCASAIERLCSQNLIVGNPYNQDKPFKITLQLCFAKAEDLTINIQTNVKNVLKKRFNAESGVLNLENFAKDPDLEEYCALAQPKLLAYILHLSKYAPFKALKLSNNDIEDLTPMEALEDTKNSFSVDLRNNAISEVSQLGNMKHLKVVELWLDGNPICDEYDELTYGKVMKDIFPKLEKLDGVNLHTKGFLPLRRNYLCDLAAHELIDQFLEHYFTRYDSINRSVLEGMYHKDAMFSMNSMYLQLQTTSLNARLAEYKKISRNLKQISDFSKTHENLFVGSDRILATLSSLPWSQHDPYSFTVDLISYTENTLILVVCGVFKEIIKSPMLPEKILGFSRTFVLLAGEEGEYTIVNEMMHVTNATSTQAVRAFKQLTPPKATTIELPEPQNDTEKNNIAEALKAVTGMKLDWSHKCLQECKYDLKKALMFFVDLFKADKIPAVAFDSTAEARFFYAKQLLKENYNPYDEQFSNTTDQLLRQAKPPIGIVQPMNVYSSRKNVHLLNQPDSMPPFAENVETYSQSPIIAPLVGTVVQTQSVLPKITPIVIEKPAQIYQPSNPQSNRKNRNRTKNINPS